MESKNCCKYCGMVLDRIYNKRLALMNRPEGFCNTECAGKYEEKNETIKLAPHIASTSSEDITRKDLY